VVLSKGRLRVRPCVSCVGWLVLHINAVKTNSSTMSSFPLTFFVMISVAIFGLLCLIVWNGNYTDDRGNSSFEASVCTRVLIYGMKRTGVRLQFELSVLRFAL
jgi:hypothetical protein